MAAIPRPVQRTRPGGPQRVKIHDENAVKGTTIQQPQASVAGPTAGGAKRVPVAVSKPAHSGRAVLGEITANINQNKNISKHTKANNSTADDISKIKRGRSVSVTVTSGAQRVPVKDNRSSLQAQKPQRLSIFAQPAKLLRPSSVISTVACDEEEEEEEIADPPPSSEPMDVERVFSEGNDEHEEKGVSLLREDPPLEVETDNYPSGTEVVQQSEQKSLLWPHLAPSKEAEYAAEVEKIRSTFEEPVDPFDTTMVSEYSTDILEYMGQLELTTMPEEDYMDNQQDLSWDLREQVIDWMCQVHMRYHMSPETLWIAVNIMDRFLTLRCVSAVKLQLVGLTAIFVASKYEEIMAPNVEEMVFVTGEAFAREEILKGERIILNTLGFQISQYCSPYTWLRRISKADDFDINTRTLSKFLMEVSLLDYRFLPVKPSLVAAIGMYTARKMLGGDWDQSFVFYSGFVEEYLIPGQLMILQRIAEPDFVDTYVCKKYASKKTLKASLYAMDWVQSRERRQSRAVTPQPPAAR